MPTILLTFHTTHHALWAEEVAAERSIPCELVPAPPAAAARCNLALEVLTEDEQRAEAALREAGVEFEVYTGVDR